MKKSYLFLADGFEEIEALVTVDMLRRAGIDITTVSINDTPLATGANGIPVTADKVLAQTDTSEADWLILPGGMPGATNLVSCAALVEKLRAHYANEGNIAAICASPAYVLGALGMIADGVKATCYPGCESAAPAVEFTGRPVEVSGNIITGRGPGYTMQFALAIIRATLGDQQADNVATGLLLNEK